MIDECADFLVIEGLVDETIDPEVDGLFKKAVSSPWNHEEDTRLGHSLDVMEKAFFPDARSVDIQDEDVEFFSG